MAHHIELTRRQSEAGKSGFIIFGESFRHKKCPGNLASPELKLVYLLNCKERFRDCQVGFVGCAVAVEGPPGGEDCAGYGPASDAFSVEAG